LLNRRFGKPGPWVRIPLSSPVLSTDGGVAQRNCLQSGKTVSSNLTLCSSCKKTTEKLVDKAPDACIMDSVDAVNAL